MIRERKNRKSWTPKEISDLQEKYPSGKYILEEVEKELQGHSRNAIRLKANRLGLYRPIPDVPEELKPSLDIPNKLISISDSNSLYNIVKAIQLLSQIRESNSSLVIPEIQKLLSQIEINSQLWKKLAYILASDNIRRATFYLNLEGATTHRILVHTLKLIDSTTWRIIKDLEAFQIIFPSMKIPRTRNSRGPQVTVYQTPDATPEQIQHAMTLHKKLESPQYLASLNLAQTILNDYPALGTKEISIKDLRQYARVLGYRDPGIVDLAAHQLQEQGIKVWR